MTEFEVAPDGGGTHYRVEAKDALEAAELVGSLVDGEASVYEAELPVGYEGEDAE